MANTRGDVGIETTAPDSSALPESSPTIKGLPILRMTTTERDATHPHAGGPMMYNIETGTIDAPSTPLPKITPYLSP